jgi:DNA-binding beta-propeller fold protein YncE
MVLNYRSIQFLAFCGLIALLSGCATRKPAPSYTFFPPAPDEPRVQFLTSFASDLELGRGANFTDFVTGKPIGPGPLVKPYGLALHKSMLYVCDTMANSVQVFDLVKKRGHYFAPRGEGRLVTPINITIDSDGTRYVADTGRDQVVIFGNDGTYQGAIGKKDEMKPCDVVVTADRLYVADLKNHCIQVLNKSDHTTLFTIPRDPKAAEGKLFSPTNLALDQQGHLLVSDTGAFTVLVYELEGKFLRTIGSQGVAPGLFARPKGVAVDHEGRTYVADASSQVVQLFDPDGKLLMYFGKPGSSTKGELYLPAAVKIDYDSVDLYQKEAAPGYQFEYLILVTSQFGENKVNLFGFLRKK